MPRKLAVVHYFTFHAELLPHTEQVVFHKVSFWGNVKRTFVDIKNLEKIEADIVPSKAYLLSKLIRSISLGHKHI